MTTLPSGGHVAGTTGASACLHIVVFVGVSPGRSFGSTARSAAFASVTRRSSPSTTGTADAVVAGGLAAGGEECVSAGVRLQPMLVSMPQRRSARFITERAYPL